MKNCYSIDRLLKNVNVLQVRIDTNSTISKGFANTYNVEILNDFNLELQLILSLQLKIN